MANPGIGFKNHTRDFGKVQRDWAPGQVVEVKGDPRTAIVESGDTKRKDAGKDAGFWLLPTRPLTAVAKVFKIGADKYTPRGWEAGMEWSRVLDPLFRHLFKWMRGERYDEVDGQHHLASVIWACLVLMEYEETHPELDDLKR